MKNDNDTLVPARVYTSDAQANIALGMLRTQGIPCILDNELAYTTLGIQLAPSDGIRLMVRQGDLERVLELLGQDGD